MPHTHFTLTRREAPSLLSIVIPIYNEQESVPALVSRLTECLDSFAQTSEVIFVNDGSTDATIDLLLNVAKTDCRFKVLSLARNFGHQMAATAGLDHARGDAVVLMDGDLQDPPELIREMIRGYCEGYDVVYAHRIGREGESILKRFTAWAFYRLMRMLIHRDLPPDVGDFRLLSRKCLDGLRSMREVHRFLRGMVTWVGFPQTSVEFVRPRRAAGTTKYSFRKMFLFAWNAGVSFSPFPLRLSFAFGILLTVVGITYGVYALARTIVGLYTVPGWTSSIVLTCLVGGTTMFCLGILGEYTARIFEEVKGRPLYLVAMTVNMSETPVVGPAVRPAAPHVLAYGAAPVQRSVDGGRESL